jgi:hypothetical protein
LSLDCYAPFQSHEVREVDRLDAEKLFHDWGFRKGASVVIFPDAHNIKWFNLSHLAACIELLRQVGLDVIVDTSNPEFSTIAKTSHLDLKTIVPFMDLCGHSVIVRSGMADLTIGSAAKRVILYPDDVRKNLFSIAEHGGDLVEIAALEMHEWATLITNYFARANH